MPNRRPQLKLIAASPAAASPEEAAAIVAAIERFMRATAPTLAPGAPATDRWRRAAVIEATERESWPDVPDPWINT